jgi:cytochrome c-type biogenesis protein CcmH
VCSSDLFKAKAAPDDTVFVFAKALQGPRMPLAVVRAKVSDLPLAFNLDDSSAMSPELKLSGFPEVKIEARVSKSGDAIAKPGDLIGTLSPVKPGAKDLKLVVDKVLP